MGSIRFLLALSVMLWHLGPYAPVTGYSAVILFYIMSGFYMSLVLNEGYVTAGPWAFYLSRFLRLFPVYWIVALVTLVFFAITDFRFVTNLSHASSWLGWALVLISNFTILGLDIVNDVAKSGAVNHTLLRLVGPAWTLAIELQFYAVIPLFARQRLIVCAWALLLLLGTRFLIVHSSTTDLGLFYAAPGVWCFFLWASQRIAYPWYPKGKSVNCLSNYLAFSFWRHSFACLVPGTLGSTGLRCGYFTPLSPPMSRSSLS